MAKLSKDVEREAVEIARVLRPHLEKQPTIYVLSGEKRDTKRYVFETTMDGTSKVFDLPESYKFSNVDSVVVTVHPLSTISMYGEMVAPSRVKVVAASSASNVKIKILMRGY